MSIYSAAKMSLTSIVQSLRVEHYSDGIHIGLVYVGITEIDQGKTAMGVNGQPVLLAQRKESFLVNTMDQVANKIAGSILSRKKQTIIGISGKVYYQLVQYFPRLFEFLLIRNEKRTSKLYK